MPECLNSCLDSFDQQIKEFDSLSLEKKMSLMYRQMLLQTFEFKTQINNLEEASSIHKSRLDALETSREQDLTFIDDKLASVSQTIVYTQRFKSQAEIVITGLPIETVLSESDVTSAILKRIEVQQFISDVVSIRKHNKKSRINNNNVETARTFSLIVKFKSDIVRNEVMRKKKIYDDIFASEIFTELSDISNNRIAIYEWLQPHIFKLFQKTREIARQKGYERVWILNETISVRKDANSAKIEIFSESDLDKLY